MTRAAPCVLHICCTLLGGQTQGKGPQPEGFEHVLEEAWPGAIRHIRQDASQELEKATQVINRLEDELATMQKERDNLFIRYEKECDHCHKAEEDISHYRARLHLREDSMRSSSSSTQSRAQSPWHSTLSMAPPSTTTTTPTCGTPPCKTAPLTVVPSTLPSTPTTLTTGRRALMRRIGLDTILLHPVQQAHYHWPNQSRQTNYICPNIIYVLLLKIVKPRLQASLPASVTGVLPRPLGKAPARPATRTHQWYDECDISDPHFQALY